MKRQTLYVLAIVIIITISSLVWYFQLFNFIAHPKYIDPKYCESADDCIFHCDLGLVNKYHDRPHFSICSIDFVTSECINNTCTAIPLPTDR